MIDSLALRDLYERITRNVLQAMGPALVATASSGSPLAWQSLLLSTGYVVVLTALKFLLDWTAAADAPWWLRLLDRVGSAAAASVLAVAPLDWPGWSRLTELWPMVGWSALASSVLALIMFVGAPPGADRARHRLQREPDDSDPRHRAD